jgi:hypothetical protein
MPKYLESMAAKYTWTFKARLRARAFGWRGSHLACQRLKEAVTEIKKVARKDPVTAGDGVVSLMERIWPAFQDVDTSSGALGSAVYWAQDELLPIAIESPADRKTRDKWLERLWQAIEDDGVDYLSLVGDRWGELCDSREVASSWADRFLGLLRTAWSDRPGNCVRESSVCLSSLLAAGRHQELLQVLALQRFPFWPDRKFGMQALASEGRMDEALAYAEASRGLNFPRANSVLHAGLHPNCGEPLVQTERRVFHDGSDLDTKLRLWVAVATLPEAAGSNIANVLRSASRANDAVLPFRTMRHEVANATVRIVEVYVCLLERLWFAVYFAHTSTLTGTG